MNREIIKGMALLTVALSLLATQGCKSPKEKANEHFIIEVRNGYTPVKDQGRGQTCWIYAMLSTIETEHIGRGDSVHLSPYYVIRAVLEDKARKRYFASIQRPFSLRGTGMMLVNAIELYGAMPYDAYSAGREVNATAIAKKLEHVVGQTAGSRIGLSECLHRSATVLDDAFGPVPRRVYMYSAEYTPQEFARSVCAPGEYFAFTSFTHHPFYTSFELEIPDNYGHDLFYNLPIDSLMAQVEQAVRSGHGVCWEGDTSEPGFSFNQGVARLPHHLEANQQNRQRAFERFTTTDDHCMAIIGIAHDKDNHKYFIMKNSWGTDNPYGGLMYVSFDYVKMKTVAFYMPRQQ